MKKTGLRNYDTQYVRQTESGKTKVIKEVVDWIKTIAIGVIVGVLLVIFVIQRDNVYGDSMNPTLYTGDIVFTQKIATYFHNYHRGDIVILDGDDMVGYDKEEYLIKRIIGLPGEHIRIADGHVYIMAPGETEFTELQEDYLSPGMETTVRAYGVEMGYDDIILGEDEYFCMGDNRIVSNDSRTLGPFTVDRIKGIAFVVVYPLSQVQFL